MNIIHEDDLIHTSIDLFWVLSWFYL